jgi:hypothetical protein
MGQISGSEIDEEQHFPHGGAGKMTPHPNQAARRLRQPAVAKIRKVENQKLIAVAPDDGKRPSQMGLGLY